MAVGSSTSAIVPVTLVTATAGMGVVEIKTIIGKSESQPV